MKTFPTLADAATMPAEQLLRELLFVVEVQAEVVSRKNRALLDDYRSAGQVRLWKFCQEFEKYAFKNDAQFRAICFNALKNAMIDEKRRQIGRFLRGKWRGMHVVTIHSDPTDTDVNVKGLEDTLVDESESPIEAIERKERDAVIAPLLESLPPRTRQIFRYMFVLGWKQRRIAEAYGVDDAAIYQTIKRTLRNFSPYGPPRKNQSGTAKGLRRSAA